MVFSKTDPTLAFIDALSPLFGSRKATVSALIRASVDYQRWRQGVKWCSQCGAWTPLRNAGQAFALHYVRNPDGDLPYWLVCPGKPQQTTLKNPPESPAEIEAVRRHIAHRVTDLLTKD